MLQEEWKPIKGYEGLYEISNFGRVKSSSGIIKKTSHTTRGYENISLNKMGDQKSIMVHLLVWDYFGDRPRDGRKLQVDHIDNNKSNNHINNLQLLTPRENSAKRIVQLGRKQNLPLGVCTSSKNRFRAKIKIGQTNIYLGQFKTPEDASEAYKKALENIKKYGHV